MTPSLTVFTASVYPDLARLWLACVHRAFPRGDVAVEIFDDSDDGSLRPDLLPGADVIRPGAGRRDFQEAYNDALRRCATEHLAFVDTDVFWVSADLFARVQARLSGDGVAAVSCVSRRATVGHGTFAVILKVAPYREALVACPGGFLPRAERDLPGDPPGRWEGHDTGDLLMREVLARGGAVDLFHLDEGGGIVRFDALTNARLARRWVGERATASIAARDPYVLEGVLGNLALRPAYERAFPGGPPFSFSVSRAAVWAALASAGPASIRASLGRAWRLRTGAKRVARFLEATPAC